MYKMWQEMHPARTFEKKSHTNVPTVAKLGLTLKKGHTNVHNVPRFEFAVGESHRND